MGRKRPRVGGQGGGHSYGGAGVGDVPPGGLTRVDLGQAHQGAGVWAWSESGRGRGEVAVSTKEAGGEVGFRPGRGAQPPLLPGGGQSGMERELGLAAGLTSRQPCPHSLPGRVSLMLPCPYDPSLIDPRTPLFPAS